MRFRILLLTLLILLSSFSFAQQLQYTRTVKGNLFLPPGQGAQNSKIRFQLKYCAGQNGRVPVTPGNPPGPSGIIVGFEPFDVNVGSDGTWQTQIYGNDQILCGTDTSGPSRWLIQPVFNGAAGTGVEFQIQSCGPIFNCAPFLPDSAPQCSLTVTTNCALEGGTVDQPDTTVTVNATMAIPNAINFGNQLLPPANGSVINFLLNGNQAGAYLPGNGNAATCLSGTGTWVLCGGGGAGGVTGATPNRGLVLSGTTLGLITCSTNQYLSWSGSAWVCTTLTGGGGSGSLPTIPQYNLYASNGSGGAQDSTVKAGPPGFLMSEVMLATGDITSAPAPFQLFPNASVEYFPSGYTWSGGTAGAAHGLAMYMSHSAASTSAGNGGIALGGGNSGGAGNQVYLDCEATGCDFKVNVTHNGAALGGGGGGTLPTTPSWDLFASNNAGAAQASGVLGQAGFLRAFVLEATGTGTSSPWGVPNGSIEYFPTGGFGAGGVNGVALHVSHSGSATGFGGIALAGGNTSGADQLYLDCEGPPVVPALGCDFKVPITLNGSAIGGGGGGVAWGAITGTLSAQADLQTALNGKLGTGGTLTPTICPAGQAAAGILASGNATGCVAVPSSTANQTTGVFTNQVSATLTSTTTALVWACWDTSTPANAIYPSNVSVSSAFLVTFTFTVPQTGQCVVNASGGAGGGGGGGSGTVSSGTGNYFAWYASTGTTVNSNSNLSDNGALITSQEPLAAPGINVTGSGGIAMTGAGGTLPTPVSGQGGLGIGPGNVPQFYSNGGAWTAIASGGGGGTTIYNCTIPADVTFSTTAGTICSQALGATARQWRVHCSIPWNFTGGSGTSNVVIGINLSATPSYQTYVSPVMWTATGSSNMGAVSVTASGNTPIVTATGLTAGTGGTIFTVSLDGTVAAAANTTFYIYGTASVGTAAFRPGVTCELI